jgi:ABC-type nitrate/sulfonate/bicarbonate transport system permease component
VTEDGLGERRGLPAWVLGLTGLAGLMAVVELVPRTGLVQKRFLPPFSEMLSALRDEAVRTVERRVLRWHPSVRREVFS